LLGESPAIVELRIELARLVQRGRASRRFPPILIQGETGTGKGLLARTLHRMGPRAARPFVDIDCTAIPETLLEGELFGFEQGAFTDARRAKPGLVQTANGGTLFLDEIGPVPLSLQRKLLKAIEEREVRPLGSTRRAAVDVWIIAATNERLSEAVEAGSFRADLYHRLAGVTFWIPPLRERGADTLLLAEHFLERACADYGTASKALARDARDALMSYAWPGNVRELANVMERVVLLSDATVVTADLLGLSNRPPVVSPARAREAVTQRRAKTLTRAQVTDALRRSGMKLAAAAVLLGVPRNSLRYQVAKLGIPLKSALAAPPDVKPDQIPGALEAPRPNLTDWTSLRLDDAERRPTAVLFLRFAPRDGVSSLQFGAPVRVAIEKIAEHGGTVSLVDDWGVSAVFEPATGEKPVSNAARAALAVMKAVSRTPEAERVASLSAGLDADPGGQDDDGAQADGSDTGAKLIHHAHELATAGEPGTILVTRRAGGMLARKFSLERVMIEQDGVPLSGYRLVARNSVLDEFRGSAMTPLVGRAEELESLLRRFQVTRAGHCHVVGIRGEPGLGKSRVLYEFNRRLEGQSVTWIVAHCLPNGVSGRASAINEIIAGMLSIEEDDDPRTVAQKVRLGVEGCGSPDLQTVMVDDLLRFLDVLPPADRLGDPSPEAVRQRVLETFTHLARERSARHPLILAFEDMHWIDHDSEEFLFQVAERLASSSLMILCAYRSEYRPPRFARANATELRLRPLSRDDSASLVRYVAAHQSMEPTTVEAIIERASGSPLFLEELTVMAAGGGAKPGVVPVTIRAALLARVAALSVRTRKVLLAAAVLGPALRENVLAAMLDHPAGLIGDLLELEELGLLGVTEGPGRPRLRFRHGLLQEVVYDALVPPERARLHARAATALEGMHGDPQEVPEGLADELARHHAAAGQERQAIDYLLVSVKHAYERYALTEALERLDRAESLTARLAAGPERDARAVEIAVRKSWPLAQLGRLEQARDVLLQQLDAEVDVAGTPMAGEYYFGLATSFDRLGDHRAGAAWGVRAAVEATRNDNQVLLGRSHHALALTSFSAGHFDLGVDHGVEAVERLDRAGERWWAGRARWSFGLNYLGQGELPRAAEMEREAKRIGVEIKERRLEADATTALGWMQALLGEAEASRRTTREACRLAPDPLVRAIAIAARGGALLEAGRLTSAVPVLQVAVAQLRAFKARAILSLASAFLAEALAAIDSVRAQAVAEEGLMAATEAGFPFGAGWSQRALSTVARERGHLVRARDHASKALHVFARIGARFEWARTSLALAAIDGAEGDHEACARYVRAAVAAFEVLGVSYWAARARGLAASMPAVVRAGEPRATDTALGA